MSDFVLPTANRQLADFSYRLVEVFNPLKCTIAGATGTGKSSFAVGYLMNVIKNAPLIAAGKKEVRALFIRPYKKDILESIVRTFRTYYKINTEPKSSGDYYYHFKDLEMKARTASGKLTTQYTCDLTVSFAGGADSISSLSGKEPSCIFIEELHTANQEIFTIAESRLSRDVNMGSLPFGVGERYTTLINKRRHQILDKGEQDELQTIEENASNHSILVATLNTILNEKSGWVLDDLYGRRLESLTNYQNELLKTGYVSSKRRSRLAIRQLGFSSECPLLGTPNPAGSTGQHKERLLNLCDEEYVRAYYHGEFVKIMGEIPVYKKLFIGHQHIVHTNYTHLVDSNAYPQHRETGLVIESNPTEDDIRTAIGRFGYTAFFIGLDFGLHPAYSVVARVRINGVTYYRVIREFSTKNEADVILDIEFRDIVVNLIKNWQLARRTCHVLGDPASQMRSSRDGRGTREVFAEAGVFVDTAISNHSAARIGGVQSLLTAYNDPNLPPIFAVYKNCAMTIDGFQGGYAYQPQDDIEIATRQKPLKNIYSHIHDALQYAVLGIKKHYGAL